MVRAARGRMCPTLTDELRVRSSSPPGPRRWFAPSEPWRAWSTGR